MCTPLVLNPVSVSVVGSVYMGPKKINCTFINKDVYTTFLSVVIETLKELRNTKPWLTCKTGDSTILILLSYT